MSITNMSSDNSLFASACQSFLISSCCCAARLDTIHDNQRLSPTRTLSICYLGETDKSWLPNRERSNHACYPRPWHGSSDRYWFVFVVMMTGLPRQ